ncbi:P-II family nitrogen regulator [Defluviitalea phaphyphila]|uniref:P-II family nitrogen regulator n=1 Tax=Defluviitalea phaphyphila TaxID=1473580 RepID=UPI0007317B22|nr:P-II family nitrogen regulator [Defluviitalea phaphyphila]
MKMIRAIIRPDKVQEVLSELSDAGFPAVTKIDVAGRGRQRGVKVGNIHYDEISKEMLMLVVDDENKDDVVRIIIKNARTGEEGAFGDGKIFINSVEEVYTISTGESEL